MRLRGVLIRADMGISGLRAGPPKCMGAARQEQQMSKAKKIAIIGLYAAVASMLTGLSLTLWQVVSTFNAVKEKVEISELVPQVSMSLRPMMVAIMIASVGFVICVTGMCTDWIQRARARQAQNSRTDNV